MSKGSPEVSNTLLETKRGLVASSSILLMKYDGLTMAVRENPVLSGSSVMKYDLILEAHHHFI